MTINIAGKEVSALVDTGATLCLIGDDVYKARRERRRILRLVDICMHLATGMTRAEGALRFQVEFDGRRKRQRFAYLRGLTSPVILGRDFLSREGIIVDLRNSWYRYDPTTPLIPFADLPPRVPCAPRTTALAGCPKLQPEALVTKVGTAKVEAVLASFDAPTEQRHALADDLRLFSATFTKQPGIVLRHRIDTGEAKHCG